MSIVERIKELTTEKSMSVAELERTLGLGNSSVRRWDERTPGVDKLQKVADYFDVSTDYLLGRTNKRKYYELNEKDKRDIGLEADRLLEGLQSGAETSFYGEPMTEEEKIQMRTILELGLQMNKEKAKKKFTPKKYRND
ncbi:helix-turn-helix domain-containing protein [Enterococcus olivae]